MYKLVTLLLIVLLLGACGLKTVRGSGDLVTESREVSGFDRVVLSGSGEVTITQDGTESLTVETDDNVMEYLTSEVKGRTLELGFEDDVIVSPTRLISDLHLKDLTGLEISGSASMEADSIEADRLEIKISGSGDIELAGNAGRQDITISGSGKCRLGDLKGEVVDISVSGSGNAVVWATESLDVNISGSGSVDYYGNPSTDLSTSGSGNINSRGEK